MRHEVDAYIPAGDTKAGIHWRSKARQERAKIQCMAGTPQSQCAENNEAEQFSEHPNHEKPETQEEEGIKVIQKGIAIPGRNLAETKARPRVKATDSTEQL